MYHVVGIGPEYRAEDSQTLACTGEGAGVLRVCGQGVGVALYLDLSHEQGVWVLLHYLVFFRMFWRAAISLCPVIESIDVLCARVRV